MQFVMSNGKNIHIKFKRKDMERCMISTSQVTTKETSVLPTKIAK